jgi:ribokinase
MQLEVPLDTVGRACALAVERGARVVLNAAPYAALPGDVVTRADPVVVNEHEARMLAETSGLPRSLLVTFGARGADWDGLRAPAVEVPEDEVVDTTGAGDAFCGALAAALAEGRDHEEALLAALTAGAANVRHAGAQPDARL